MPKADDTWLTKVSKSARVLEQTNPQQDDSDGHDADVETRHEVGVREDIDQVSDDTDGEQEVTNPVEDIPGDNDQIESVYSYDKKR